MFFSNKYLPLFAVVDILCIFGVSVDVLGVFLYPVLSKMCQNIIRTVIIHHVDIESVFCHKILPFITSATFAVTRVNWAERADAIGQEDIFFISRVTVMNALISHGT